MASMAMLTVTFSGCGKDDNNNGDDTDVTNDEWVDLGLPSGLLWASCNVGATSPDRYGDYFAWGETQPKNVYDKSTYAFFSDNLQLTKYCTHAQFGYNGFTDNLTTLQSGDDAATARLGGSARTPTYDEWCELKENTTAVWTTLNGVKGCRLTAANGNSIFLPAAGDRLGSELNGAGIFGSYWMASLYFASNYAASTFVVSSNEPDMFDSNREFGHSVRAVRSAR